MDNNSEEAEETIDEQDNSSNDKTKSKKFSTATITWQITQFDKIGKYINDMLDFDNKLIDLPQEHELRYTTKRGKTSGITSVKVQELFKYTYSKLNNVGVDIGVIGSIDVRALLKCIDTFLGEVDKIKQKIADRDNYILQANQVLQIKINELLDSEIELEKYKKENAKMDEKYDELRKNVTRIRNDIETHVTMLAKNVKDMDEFLGRKATKVLEHKDTDQFVNYGDNDKDKSKN
jgi:hypothetical protein